MNKEDSIKKELSKKPLNTDEVIEIAHKLSRIVGSRVTIKHTSPNIWEYLDNSPSEIHWSKQSVVLGKIETPWNHVKN